MTTDDIRFHLTVDAQNAITGLKRVREMLCERLDAELFAGLKLKPVFKVKTGRGGRRKRKARRVQQRPGGYTRIRYAVSDPLFWALTGARK